MPKWLVLFITASLALLIGFGGSVFFARPIIGDVQAKLEKAKFANSQLLKAQDELSTQLQKLSNAKNVLEQKLAEVERKKSILSQILADSKDRFELQQLESEKLRQNEKVLQQQLSNSRNENQLLAQDVAARIAESDEAKRTLEKEIGQLDKKLHAATATRIREKMQKKEAQKKEAQKKAGQKKADVGPMTYSQFVDYLGFRTSGMLAGTTFLTERQIVDRVGRPEKVQKIDRYVYFYYTIAEGVLQLTLDTKYGYIPGTNKYVITLDNISFF